jgi:hypothetical protein
MEPSKNRAPVLFAIAVAAIGLILWIILREDSPAALPAVSGKPTVEEAAGDSAPAPLPPIVDLSIATELAATLHRPDGNPEEELQAVAQLIYLYRQGFGENPVGQNEDIVAALLGENEKRSAYLPKNIPVIEDGKLVDRWGTPYWFHPVSGREMEIRSAGPDRELFTGDDLTNP